jgi:hypothetical protein
MDATELKSNRRALLALLLFTLLAAVAVGIGLVARIVDDDAGRPNRAGATTLDEGARDRPRPESDDLGGAVAVVAIGLGAAACVVTPFLIARRRRSRAVSVDTA